MQQNYSKKTDPIQKTSKNTASSVLDASSQSEALQRKADMANNAAQREEAPRPNNTGMPDNLKSGIESLSGFSMDDVRVHYNSNKPATVQALAYTQGTDIHVAPGQEKHLPHEAWHVAQQMAGRVSPTTNINGMPVNDNAALEQEADVMGEKAAIQKKNINKIMGKTTIDQKTLQLAPEGKYDLICAADIWYRDPATQQVHRIKGVGYNNAEDKDDVIKIFSKRELHKLANVPEPGNPRGKCAEPHAVADALKKDNNITINNIVDVYVSDAVVRNFNGIHYNGGDSIDNQVGTYERCKTCQQWISSTGHIREEYLQQGSEIPAQIETSKYNRMDRFLKKPSKDGQAVDSTQQIIPDQYFRNTDLLTIDPIPAGLFTPSEILWNNATITSINEKKGLRTTIKKQMLKNTFYEICCNYFVGDIFTRDEAIRQYKNACNLVDYIAIKKWNDRNPTKPPKTFVVQDYSISL